MIAESRPDSCPRCNFTAAFPCIVDVDGVPTFAKACIYCGAVRPSAATAPTLVQRLQERASFRI